MLTSKLVLRGSAVARVQYAIQLEPHRLHRYLPKHVGPRFRPTQLSRYQLWIH